MCNNGAYIYIYISIFRRKIVIYFFKKNFVGVWRDGEGWEGVLGGFGGWEFLSYIGEF